MSPWLRLPRTTQKQKAERFNSLTEQDIKALKKLAKKVLKAKTEYYAKQVGVSYGKITITSAKTRFGSCSSKGNISYSYRLMLYPESAIDYVVVHELAHRKYMNHQKAFYKEIEKVLPDYKKRKMLLKKWNGWKFCNRFNFFIQVFYQSNHTFSFQRNQYRYILNNYI